MTASWLVQIEEDGMGEVVWQGDAADAAEALRNAADHVGWNVPSSRLLDGFRDVKRDGSRFESDDAGPQLVIEAVR